MTSKSCAFDTSSEVELHFNKELAQKPHEPHAAFGHCAKLQDFCWVPLVFV
jgi:hypothetical protein